MKYLANLLLLITTKSHVHQKTDYIQMYSIIKYKAESNYVSTVKLLHVCVFYAGYILDKHVITILFVPSVEQ